VFVEVCKRAANVKRLIALSDNAGGQNKNKHILNTCSYNVDNTHIEAQDHKFLISGPSFMECDQNFGVIEDAKKRNKYVFVPKQASILPL
jgi:hypothetical protein